MAGVEEKDIDRLLANPPEKIEIEVKYKIAVTVMEGVSQTILKKVIVVLLKISRMIKSKCTFRFWIIKVVEGLPKLLRVFREGLA